jgi:pimeloyl-ACP methyl ester carboxylesterase
MENIHTTEARRAGYAPVNGLEMYYEIHGSGQPLVVLHGAFMTIDLMGPLVPGLARTRQVIAVELQGHGHTADIDRPLLYDQLADDTSQLLEHLGIDQADVYGYSLGGGVALQVALRHPEQVRKLVVASASYTSEGMYPEVLAGIEHITPDLFTGTPWRAAYDSVAPNPDGFAALVDKIRALDLTPFAWPADAVRQPSS